MSKTPNSDESMEVEDDSTTTRKGAPAASAAEADGNSMDVDDVQIQVPNKPAANAAALAAMEVDSASSKEEVNTEEKTEETPAASATQDVEMASEAPAETAQTTAAGAEAETAVEEKEASAQTAAADASTPAATEEEEKETAAAAPAATALEEPTVEEEVPAPAEPAQAAAEEKKEKAASAATAPAPTAPAATVPADPAAKPDPEKELEETRKKIEEKRSLLSRLPKRDSRKPLRYLSSAAKELVEEGIKLQKVRGYVSTVTENGKSSYKNEFKDHDLDVTLKYKRAKIGGISIRDVDVEVKKGPAVVSLAMTDSSGKKISSMFGSKTAKLVLEFDKDGKAKDSIPDLSLVQINDEPKPGYAFVMNEGKPVYLPINAEKAKSYKTQIQAHRQELAEEKAKLPNPKLLAKEEGIEVPIISASKFDEIAKTDITVIKAEDFELGYKKLCFDVLTAKDDSARKEAEAKKKEFGSKTPTSLSEENAKKAMEKAEKEALMEKIKLDLKKSMLREIEAAKDDNQPGIDKEKSVQEKAKSYLEAAGVDVKPVLKECTEFAYKEAVKDEFADMLAAQDPAGARKAQNHMIDKMIESGHSTLTDIMEGVKLDVAKDGLANADKDEMKEAKKAAKTLLEPYGKKPLLDAEKFAKETRLERDGDKVAARSTPSAPKAQSTGMSI